MRNEQREWFIPQLTHMAKEERKKNIQRDINWCSAHEQTIGFYFMRLLLVPWCRQVVRLLAFMILYYVWSSKWKPKMFPSLNFSPFRAHKIYIFVRSHLSLALALSLSAAAAAARGFCVRARIFCKLSAAFAFVFHVCCALSAMLRSCFAVWCREKRIFYYLCYCLCWTCKFISLILSEFFVLD